MPDIPQFKLPLQIIDGDIATIEQGEPVELAQRVSVLCATPRGTIELEPGFGLADPVFRRRGADVGDIEQQIATYVPGADILATEDPDLLNGILDRVGVRVAAR